MLTIDTFLPLKLALMHEHIESKMPFMQLYYSAKTEEERKSCLIILETLGDIFRSKNEKSG